MRGTLSTMNSTEQLTHTSHPNAPASWHPVHLLLVPLLAVALTGCIADARTEPATPESPLAEHAIVIKHTDGDTAYFRYDDGTEEKVRFIGMDTPEVYGGVEPYGREASAYTERMIPLGSDVWLEADIELRDRYDRLLAYVWLAPPQTGSPQEVREQMLNALLVADGYAMVSTYPPNVKYEDMFLDAQVEAREASRGLWGE